MTQNPAQDVALIVGGGPGISSSCARLFAKEGMRVAVAARQPNKPILQALEKAHGVRRYACDAADPAAIELLFRNVVKDLGIPTLVVHNIDGRVPGIFRKGHPCAPAGRNDRRRQHGRSRPHRGDLSAAASSAQVDLGVRGRASTVAREVVGDTPL